MQTSSMMLDSSIEKVLTTERVTSPIQLQDESEPGKDDSAIQPSTTSEAEVRLVVRLIVEERIVFNGKVERVNQLECEELSRLVSRVAWVGSKEEEKPSSQTEDETVIEKNHTSSSDSVQQTPSVATNSTHEDTAIQSLEPSFSSDEILEHVQEKLLSNIYTSDHIAYVKSSPTSIQSPEKHTDSTAQVHSQESNTTVKCDIDVKTDKTHIEQCLKSPPFIEELDLQANNESEIIPKSNTGNVQLEVQVEDSCAENQSIVDTLNDCVNIVDLESRSSIGELKDIALSQESVEQIADSIKPEHNGHNVSTDITDETLTIDKNVDDKVEDLSFNNLEYNNKLIDTLSEDLINGESVSIEQIKDRNSIEQSIFHPTESAGSTLTKRKSNLNDNSVGKRIRKSATKEQHNSNARTNAKSKGSEKQNVAPIKLNKTISLLANNKPPRPVKIFAKWSDNHFYPGTIVRRAKDRKYVISFFDGAQRNVAETDLIPLSNIAGKQVRVTVAKNYCANAIVHEQRLVSDQPIFNVEYQQDGLVRKLVPLRDIFLTGEQGAPLINQPDKNSGASNFADVDLDNIIYEKRSRRFQEMEDFELTENSTINNKRKRSQYNMRNTTPRLKTSPTTNECSNNGLTPDLDIEGAKSPDVLKTNFLCPNSNPPSEGSSSTSSSNVPNNIEQEYYFTSSSPHRTKTSLLL